MKHLDKMNEITSKWNEQERKYNFDPAENGQNTITFYLHNRKAGFVMEIVPEDQKDLEKILNKNKIDYTVSTATNILPF